MEMDFIEIADQISRRVREGGLSTEEIQDIVYSKVGEINCYPGKPSNKCHKTALFVSLSGIKAKGNGHLNFKQMLKKLVKHLQNLCPGFTKHAVIITDDWWTESYESFLHYIEEFKRNGVKIDAYLLQKNGKSIKLSI